MESNNKRLAKNTLILYLRMFLVMGLGLYTSRLVLDVLGKVDFGTYSVVGGVVIMMSFLNNSLAGATQRFLTYELGKGNMAKLKKLFSICFFNHVLIALAVLLLGETVGLWFLNHKLNIPEERQLAAHVVYQLSLLTTCVNFLRIPYHAAIIARERMGAFSVISIVEVLLKLLLVCGLLHVAIDRLIMYAVFLLLLSLVMLLLYVLYGRLSFEECRISAKRYAWQEAEPMLSFSSWDLFGNFSFMARNQGLNIIINLFFGVVLNASVAIADRVQGALEGFAASFLTALRPRIVKMYVSEEREQLAPFLQKACHYILIAMLLLSAILFLNAHYILNWWLKEVPSHAVVFVQIIELGAAIGAAVSPLSMLVQAQGDIRKMSLYSGLILLGTLPANYLLFRLDYSPAFAFAINAFSQLARGVVYLFLVKQILPEFKLLTFLWQAYGKALALLLAPIGGAVFVQSLFSAEEGFHALVASSIALILSSAIVLSIFDCSIRKIMFNFGRKIICSS